MQLCVPWFNTIYMSGILDGSWRDLSCHLFSSPEPKAQGELIVWDSSRRPSVRLSVRASTLSNMNISETSRPIVIKFHLDHHWGGGLAA